MSFQACITHDGEIVFQEKDAIDFELLSKKTGASVSSKLKNLIGNSVRVEDQELLKRCRNCKKYQLENNAGGVAFGFVRGLAKGLTYGLSDVAFKKSFPRLKNKHLLHVKKIMLKSFVGLGLTPQTIVVLDDFDGINDTEGNPHLVPQYQFSTIYFKDQNKKIDFAKEQKVLQLKHQEKIQRCKAQGALIAVSSNAGNFVKTLQAQRRLSQHTSSAEMILQQRLSLQSMPDSTSELSMDDEEEEIVVVPSDGGAQAASLGSQGSGKVTVTVETIVQSKPKVSTGSPLERKLRKDLLIQHTRETREFLERLKSLVRIIALDVEAAAKQHAARVNLHAELANWVDQSPLMGDSVKSTFNRINKDNNRLTATFESEYDVNITKCALQLQASVTEQLESTLKEIRECVNGLEHYERKVESLRSQYTKKRSLKGTNDNGLAVLAEKLARNEEKLIEAIQTQEHANERKICASTAMQNSWIVMYPVVSKLLKHDVNAAVERSDNKQELQAVLNGMLEAVRAQGFPFSVQTSNSAEIWDYLLQNSTDASASSESQQSVAESSSPVVPPETYVIPSKQTSSTVDDPKDGKHDWTEIHDAVQDIAEDIVDEIQSSSSSSSSSSCDDSDSPELQEYVDFLPDDQTNQSSSVQLCLENIEEADSETDAASAVGREFAQDPPGDFDPPGDYEDDDESQYSSEEEDSSDSESEEESGENESVNECDESMSEFKEEAACQEYDIEESAYVEDVYVPDYGVASANECVEASASTEDVFIPDYDPGSETALGNITNSEEFLEQGGAEFANFAPTVCDTDIDQFSADFGAAELCVNEFGYSADAVADADFSAFEGELDGEAALEGIGNTGNFIMGLFGGGE